MASIGEQTFWGCSLTTVTIPSTVTYIGSLAFACRNLEHVYCLAKQPPVTRDNLPFDESYSERATLYVPSASLALYKSTWPWNYFHSILTLSGEDIELKCALPTISYADGQLILGCETDDVEFVTDIADSDVGIFRDSAIELSATYNIRVIAKKAGYTDSDAATATICWIGSEPDFTVPVCAATAGKVLIQSHGGNISISGAASGTPISVYDTAGHLAGSAKAASGTTSVSTTLRKGEVAIVRMSNRTLKVVMQ